MAKKRKFFSTFTGNSVKRPRRSGHRTKEEDISTSTADGQSALVPGPTNTSPNERIRVSDLLRIPAELLEHIAEHLDAIDAGSLRLVFKEVAERIEYVFANKFFSDRSFLMSDIASLSTLLHISTHAIYSKSMKRILLYPTRLKRLSGIPKLLEGRGERRERRELKRMHEELLREEDSLYCDYLLARILKTIFLNFKDIGNLPNICMGSALKLRCNVSYLRPWGWKRLQTITNFPNPLQLGQNARGCDLFIALLEADYGAEEISFARCDEYKLPMLGFTIPVNTFHSANLRRLELSIAAMDGDYDDDEHFVNSPLRREEILGLVTFMWRVNNLEHLTLHLEPLYRGDWEDENDDIVLETIKLRADVFHSIASKSFLNGTPILLEIDGMLLPKLKSIDLRYHQLSLGQLLEFCAERKETLQSVKLNNIVEMNADLRHDAVAGRILTASGGDTKTKRKNVEVSSSCYSGAGWSDLLHYTQSRF